MFRTIKEITFKVNPYCNLNCVYCFQTYDTKTHNKCFDLYDELVAFMQTLPLGDQVEIKMTGGEASLYCDEMRRGMKKLRKLEHKMDVRLFGTTISNGTNMEGLIELFDEGILDPNGSKFSWDGIYSCSRSRKPKNPVYTDEFFNDKIKLLGKSKYGEQMLVRTAVTPDTVDDLYTALEYCLDNGCTKWEYYFLTDCDDYTDPEFVKRFRKQIEKIADKYNEKPFNYFNWDTLAFTELVLKRDNEQNRLRSIGCRHLGKSLYIHDNGDVFPCGFFVPDSNYGHGQFKLGNIKEGFDINNVDGFIKEYTAAPMCDWQYCDNMHCFECPALTKYRTGNMQHKLCQACQMRDAERDVFLKNQHLDLDYEKIRNTFAQTNEWNIQSGLPDLRWKQ